MGLPSPWPSPHTDEAELIGRLRAGEESAFAEIVRAYRPRLLAFARRLLAGKCENAEDVVQEALMRAHRALRRDEREMQLAPWLFTLTRNCCLDELSRLRGGETLSLEESGGEQILIDRRSPDVVAESRASLREMLDGIATLPIEQRHALVRREVDGVAYAQIADELGASTEAARALVHRARRSLLAYRTAGQSGVCATAQADLLKAHRTGRRAAHATHRHLLVCADCRAHRARLKALRRSLHAMHPGPAIALGAAVVKLGSATGKLGGLTTKIGAPVDRLGRAIGRLHGHTRVSGLSGAAVASAKTAAVTTGVLAALGVAVGGTLVFNAGDPSPLTIKSPALPDGTLRAGALLPAGTAIVTKTARLAHGRATVTLSCPAQERVADLLPPASANVTAGYAAATSPGASTSARVMLLGSHPAQSEPVTVAVLCRHPSGDGALVPSASGVVARASQLASVCVTRAFLLDRPRGRPIGSVSLAQPLQTLARNGAWEQVHTQFHETGWLPRDSTCGR